MEILRTIFAARQFLATAAKPVVLVPTMGALHRGHTSLIDQAREVAGSTGTVIVSIFVNPTQFGPHEDLDRYPRPFADDCQLAEQHGADAVFHPSAAEMYPEGYSTWVDESSVSLPLDGAARPGHFRGVCTVVTKLFLITQADTAIFGRKDFQQCAVIQRIVRDLHLPVKLVFGETVREPDGLALSSRNAYLTAEERAQAPAIRRALLAAQAAFQTGEKSAAALRILILDQLKSCLLAQLDYIELVDSGSLTPVQVAEQGTVIAGAVFFGKTRLIDNLWL